MDEDEIYDEEELEELYEGALDEDELDISDVLGLVMINRKRKKRISIELQDKEGDTVELKDIINELMKYIKDKMQDEESNQFASQIMPLMSQSVGMGLHKMIGLRQTAFHLSQEITRMSLIYMMAVSFLFLKFIQQKGLVIHTFEEDVTEEELEALDRKSKANETMVLASMAGQDPRMVLEAMKEQGLLTQDDLRDMLGGEVDDDGEDN
jgi:hypothetical protein